MKGFKITLTAIYSNDDVSADQISDDVWQALKKAGHGIALCNVSSIKQIKKKDLLDGEISKIKQSLMSEGEKK